MRCSTCKKFYVCRRCHDDAEDHLMNRYEVQEVKCMRCGLVQSSSNCCMSTKCKGAPFARYYCSVCNFWDDDESKEIYHCSKCVICRVGRGIGTDRQHCDTCGCCYPIEHFRDHHCIPKQLQSNCPVCNQFLFTSVSMVLITHCGHAIHEECMRQMLASGIYKCPLCMKTLLDMMPAFALMCDCVANTRMPPEYQHTTVLIFCNDCERKSTVPYHFLGHPCPFCHSFNTSVLQMFNSPDFSPDGRIVEPNVDPPRQPIDGGLPP
eukprot:TRINITY_DN6039_c1_g1_i4.p1 TRINITY_DN6039_c1_g1~~TRINITY_DN6039_c1_g1_i4.p1  ORF type:complete len:264 (-),score=59.28 TRINITY_DN6039_c1_g1_i4:71-862(-)